MTKLWERLYLRIYKEDVKKASWRKRNEAAWAKILRGKQG